MMKKSLLLMSAAMLAAGSAFADTPQSTVTFSKSPFAPTSSSAAARVRANADDDTHSLTYTKAGDVQSTYRLNGTPNKFTVYMAFEMTVQDQQPYVGNEITAINVMAGTGENGGNFRIGKARVFVTDNIGQSQDKYDATEHTIDKQANAVTSIPLSTSYTITGEKPIYVGYVMTMIGNSYYIPADVVPTAKNVNNMLIATATTTSEGLKYYNYSDQIGSLVLSCEISGDNLPTNSAQPKSLTIDAYKPLSKFSYDLTFKNTGINDINSVVVRSEVSNGVSYDRTINLESAAKSGTVTTVTVNNVPNSESGIFTISSSIIKVNNVTVDNPVAVSSTFATYNDGYPRKLVLEEATGRGCQYCPRGIVMMEYLKERYPEWIRIAVHGSTYDNEMVVNDYQQFIYDYVPGYPFAICNRAIEVSPMGDYDEYYKPVYDYYTSFPAYVNVDIEANCPEGGSTVDIKATTEFALSTDIPHQLSFVLVEDHVGPYQQTNAFAGASYDAWGWQNKPNQVTMYFDDVPVAIDSYPGIAGSLPAQIEANTEYTYNLSMPLNVTMGTNNNIKRSLDVFRIVALVTNSQTGEIVNARELLWSKDNLAGVESVEADKSVSINPGVGEINVTGAENVAVYTLDGRRVSTNGLAAGVYVVKADGMTKKVLVK